MYSLVYRIILSLNLYFTVVLQHPTTSREAHLNFSKDPRHPVHDPKYAGVAPELLPPGGESLACTVKRVVPHWKDLVT